MTRWSLVDSSGYVVATWYAVDTVWSLELAGYACTCRGQLVTYELGGDGWLRKRDCAGLVEKVLL